MESDGIMQPKHSQFERDPTSRFFHIDANTFDSRCLCCFLLESCGYCPEGVRCGQTTEGLNVNQCTGVHVRRFLDRLF